MELTLANAGRATAPDPLDVFGEHPWDVAQRQQDEANATWWQENRQRADEAFLDPQKAFPDMEQGFADSVDTQRMLAANDDLLRLYRNGEDPPADDYGRYLDRLKIAHHEFNGEGAESEKEFFAAAQKFATKRVDEREFSKKLAAAVADDVSLPIGEGKGLAGFLKEAAGKPGYDPEKAADYAEAWNEARTLLAEKMAPYKETLNQTWLAFTNKSFLPREAIAAVPDEDWPEFLQALRLRAETLPDEEKETFLAGMRKDLDRTMETFGRNAAESVMDVTMGTDPRAFIPAGVMMPTDSFGDFEGQKRMQAQFQRERNRAHEVRRILNTEYDPIDYVKGWGWAQKLPGVTVTSLTMAVPVLGMPTMAMSMQGAAQENAYLTARTHGMSEADAGTYSSAIAPAVMIPQAILEKIGFGIWANKLPGFKALLTKMDDAIVNRGLRFATKTATISAAETGIEITQDLTESAVQDIANALSSDLPDVDWNRELQGAWRSIPEIAGSMILLSMFGAAGGLNTEARASAFQSASDRQLTAAGLTPEAIQNIRNAQGPASTVAAVQAAWQTRNPDSPEAKAASEEEAAALARARAAGEALRSSGALPSIVVGKDGFTVLDGETKDEVGTAKTMGEAWRIAQAHSDFLADLQGDAVAYMATLLESADFVSKLDPDTKTELDLGTVMDRALLEATKPEMAARFALQVAMKEQAAGGTGEISYAINGWSETEIRDNLRQTTNRIFQGASALTVFHEFTHGKRREARAAGRITRADEISFIRAIDTVLGTRKTKEGERMAFLENGLTDDQVTEEMIDEAMSEIMEMEILRSREGGTKRKMPQRPGVVGVPSGFITRNLKAIGRLAPEATRKFSAFIEAVRGHFGTAMARALALKKAEREGKFDSDSYDAFLAKMMGLDLQDDHNARVEEAAASLYDPRLSPDAFAAIDPNQEVVGDDIPFSLRAATAAPFYSQLSRTLVAKMPKSATPEQVMQIAQGGAKAEEIKWSGIEQALPKLAVDGKVAKDALLEYLAAEGTVQLEEVGIGDAAVAAYEAKRTRLGEKMARGEISAEDFTRLTRDLDAQEPGIETKFEKYTLPGGENYREVVLAMPPVRINYDTGNSHVMRPHETQGMDNDRFWFIKTPDQTFQILKKKHATAQSAFDYVLREKQPRPSAATNYNSSHFPDVPNYVAHMRTNERTDANGKPGLFIEEIQSDRHQAGRKQGYREEAKEAILYGVTIDGNWYAGFGDKATAENRRDTLLREFPNAEVKITEQPDPNPAPQSTAGIPDAPFRTTWPMAMFKRALRDAVAAGKDWIGWTTGETQADRFDLSKQVGEINHSKDSRGYWIHAKDMIGNTITERSGLTADDMENLVGKEVAKKIIAREGTPMEGRGYEFFRDRGPMVGTVKKDGSWYIQWQNGQESGTYGSEESARNEGQRITEDYVTRPETDEPRTLSGDGLKVGGSGMKGFYDTMLPKEIAKYVKQWGGKVETGSVEIREMESERARKWEVSSEGSRFSIREIATGEIYRDETGKAVYYDSRNDATLKVGALHRSAREMKSTPIWRVDITPAMREGVEQGQAAFSLAPSRALDMMQMNALDRVRNPRRRAEIFTRMSREFQRLKLAAERLEIVSGTKRLRKSLLKEAAMREAKAREDLEADVYSRFWQIFADEDLVKIKSQPGHAFLADPDSPLRGRLMSRTAAMKHRAELFGEDFKGGEWDGSDGLSRSLFGGTRMPDQAAKEMYDEGLLKSDDVNEMWALLHSEQAQVAGMKEQLAKAQEQLREARIAAKEEANAWLRHAAKGQQETFNPREEILRMVASLEAILRPLPSPVRVKVGGYQQMIRIAGTEGQLKFLREQISKADRELEKWMRETIGQEFRELMEKTKPERDEAGKRPKGKIGADVHDIFRSIDAAIYLDGAETEAEATRLETLADAETTTDAQRAHLMMEANLVRLTGNWAKADSARREAALEAATNAYYGGYMQAQMKAAGRRARNEFRRADLKAATGKAGERMERVAAEVAGLGTKLGRAKQAVFSLFSFDQMLALVFGTDSETAKLFTEWELRAANAKEDAMQRSHDAVESLLTDLAGGELAGEKLRHKLATERSVTWTDHKGREQTATEMEAVSYTLMWRQEDGKRHMEGIIEENPDGSTTVLSEWHWREEDIEALEKQLSKEAKAIRMFLTDSYAAEYDRINAVFSDLYGVNMPRHKDYSPIKVAPSHAAGGQTADPVSGTMQGPGLTPGSLKNRSHSAVAEPARIDALQHFVAHTKQMEHFIAYAAFSTELMAVVNNREVGNTIEAKAGKEAVNVIRGWADYFAQGGTRDAAAHLAASHWFQRGLDRISQMALVGRASVLAIQSVQLGAALYQMPAGSYLKRLAKLTTGQLGWGKSIRSEYIQRRLSQMPPAVQQAMAGLAAGSPSRIKHATAKLGRLISGADALFTAGTYAIIYDYQLTAAKRMGIPNPEAFAEQETIRLTDQVAQPMRAGARSMMEVTSTNPAFRMMWAFASEPRQKIAMAVHQAMTKKGAGRFRAAAVTWLVSGMAATIIRSALRDLRDDGEDDEVFDEKNWSPERLILSSLAGPLGGLPLIGKEIESALYAGAGEYMPGGSLIGGPTKAVGVVKKLATGKGEWEDAIKDTETILGGVGAAFPTAAAATSWMHIARDVEGIYRNVTED